MCGILGCVYNKNSLFDENTFNLSLDALINRGPDNTGRVNLFNQKFGIFFGHTRLSIIDVSNNANQPMISENGRYMITYNGEIYNHIYLRKLIEQKKNIKWKTTSDTETLLIFIENFALDYVLNNLEGMFAFSLYDKKNNSLILVRDLAGEKPLYITTNENFLAFSSDLNSLKKIPNFDQTLNIQSINEFLKYNYIPTPLTIYQHSFKMPQASIIKIDLNKLELKRYNHFKDIKNDTSFEFKKWWSYNLLDTNKKFAKINTNEVLENIEILVEKSVSNQLISDVPIGTFLSGGVDSSLILSQLGKKKQKIESFNIGFEFSSYDESVDAEKIANYLGANHNKYICTKNEALNLIPYINQAFSEPFADSSQIPTMLVSQIASKKVKVILGGDGGDEIFGGYNRYLLANKYWKFFKILPPPYNNIFKVLKYLPKPVSYLLLDLFTNIGKISKNKINSYNKFLEKIVKVKDRKSFYENLIIEWKDNSIINSDTISADDNNNDLYDMNLSFEESMMKNDFENYMADDILCKVDRSSMYYSLENRSPLINKKLIEYMYELPLNFKINNGITKWAAKKILAKYLPNELVYKTKQGFGIPLGEWLREDLRAYAYDNLSKSSFEKHGLFNYNNIEKTISDHFDRNINSEHKLWSLIQFNTWYSNNFS